MRFVTDRCLTCGSPEGHYKTISGYWFCGEECWHAALSKYMPREYNFDQQPTDTRFYEEMCDRYGWGTDDEHPTLRATLREYCQNWYAEQWPFIQAAEAKLTTRLSAEYARAQREAEAKAREQAEKEAEKRRGLDEKEAQKQKERLEKQQARQAEEDRWQPRIFKV